MCLSARLLCAIFVAGFVAECLGYMFCYFAVVIISAPLICKLACMLW